MDARWRRATLSPSETMVAWLAHDSLGATEEDPHSAHELAACRVSLIAGPIWNFSLGDTFYRYASYTPQPCEPRARREHVRGALATIGRGFFLCLRRLRSAPLPSARQPSRRYAPPPV